MFVNLYNTKPNRIIACVKTKAQISFAVNKLRSYCDFVFSTRIEQFLYFLNPECPVPSHLLCLYSLISVRPGRKPRRPIFSCPGSNNVQVMTAIIKSQGHKPLNKCTKKVCKINFCDHTIQTKTAPPLPSIICLSSPYCDHSATPPPPPPPDPSTSPQSLPTLWLSPPTPLVLVTLALTDLLANMLQYPACVTSPLVD